MNGSKVVFLNPSEISVLDTQSPSSRHDGGWQSLIVSLALRVDRVTGRLEIAPLELVRIHAYAFEYGHGGWENKLMAAFGRVLGPSLAA